MVLENSNQNEFRNNLIYFLKSKFDDELSSKTYLVSSILNVGMLDEWKNRSFAKL